MLVVVRIGMHAPNTSRGELESNRLELAGNNGSCRTHCLWSGAAPDLAVHLTAGTIRGVSSPAS